MVLRCLDPKPHLLQSWEGVGCEGWPAGGGLHGAATSGRFQEWVANDGLGGMRFECCQYALGTLSPPQSVICAEPRKAMFGVFMPGLLAFFQMCFMSSPGFSWHLNVFAGLFFPLLDC